MLRSILLLIVLAIPPMIAIRAQASDAVLYACIAPFAVYALILRLRREERREQMHGPASGALRAGALLFVVLGAIFTGAMALVLWHVYKP